MSPELCEHFADNYGRYTFIQSGCAYFATLVRVMVLAGLWVPAQ